MFQQNCVAVALVPLLEVASVGLHEYAIAQWAFFGTSTRLSCWNNSQTGSGSEVYNKNEFEQFLFFMRDNNRGIRKEFGFEHPVNQDRKERKLVFYAKSTMTVTLGQTTVMITQQTKIENRTKHLIQTV